LLLGRKTTPAPWVTPGNVSGRGDDVSRETWLTFDSVSVAPAILLGRAVPLLL